MLICCAVAMLSMSVMTALAAPQRAYDPYERERSEKALMKYLWPVLEAARKPARVYYNAVCRWPRRAGDPDVILPILELQPPTDRQTALGAIRSVFRNIENARVSEDSSGMIRIRLGRVPEAILKTGIRQIVLSPEAQYNEMFAVMAIESAPQVRDRMRELRLKIPVRPFDYLLTAPAPGRAHVPAKFKAVTVDQALDTLATSFKAVVLYGICPKERFFDISVSGGVYFDDDWPNTPPP